MARSGKTSQVYVGWQRASKWAKERLTGGGLKQRLVGGVAFNLVAAVFSQGCTFVASVLLARVLGVVGFGSYAAVQSTLLAAALVAQMACGTAATRFVARYRESDPERCGRIIAGLLVLTLGASLFVALALLLGASSIAAEALAAPDLALPLQIGVVYVAAAAANGVLIGTLAGLEAYSRLARSAAVAGPLMICFSVSLGHFAGVPGAVIGLACGALCHTGVLGWSLRREFPRHRLVVTLIGWRAELAGLLAFSAPAAAAGLISTLLIWFATTRLTQLPSGLQEMAVYSAANAYRMMVLFVPANISTVALSVLNNLRGADDSSGYRRTLLASAGVTVLVTLLIAGVLSLLAAPLLGLYGEDFAAGETALLLLLLSTVPESLTTALYQHIQVQGRMLLSLFAISLPRELLFVGLAVQWVPIRGAEGLAAAYLAASVLASAVVCALVAQSAWRSPKTTTPRG